MCKKILAFLLAAAMTFGTAAFLPEGTFSFGTGIMASADTYGDFEVEWDDEREGYSIIGYNGDGGEVVIPQTINEKNVSRIAANAFEWNTDIVSVTISEGVAYIGTSAFYNCYNLAQVSIPSTVTFIGDGAFNDTSWLNELRETSQDHLVIVNNILVDANAYEGLRCPYLHRSS